MQLRTTAALAIVAMLSACASANGGTADGARVATSSRPVIRKPITRQARDPQFHTIPGLEGVIGASESQLIRQFGEARLNVWEGDARKLQFSGTPCVLDIYLYPTSRSTEPVATYIDTRRASDGQDVDRVACVRALRRR